MNDALYAKVRSLNTPVSHVCEVGVYKPEASNVLNFIRDGVRTTLVEADPAAAGELKTAFSSLPNVTIHNIAVADRETQLTFCRAGSSTFAADLPSAPALENDRYVPSPGRQFTVQAKPFSELDDGSIGLLSVDIEGGEWFVLKRLKSRPLVISVETHGKCYRNPFYREIRDWMKQNGYAVWYLDKSDTVFIKAGAVGRTRTARAAVLAQQAWFSAFRKAKRFIRLFHAKRPKHGQP